MSDTKLFELYHRKRQDDIIYHGETFHLAELHFFKKMIIRQAKKIFCHVLEWNKLKRVKKIRSAVVFIYIVWKYCIFSSIKTLNIYQADVLHCAIFGQDVFHNTVLAHCLFERQKP